MNTPRRHITSAVAVLGALLWLGWGCERGPNAPPEPDRPAQTNVADEAAPAETSGGEAADTGEVVVERSGELPAQPVKIVSLAPNLTELLFALGLGDRVVGVTKFCDYPPEAKSLRKVGGYTDPDLEAILATTPDLVVGMSGAAATKLGPDLEAAKIPYVIFRMRDVDETVAGVAALAEVVGVPKKGISMAGALRASLTPRGADGAARPKTLFVLGHRPLVVAGPGTFGHELIELAGGENAAAGMKAPYPQLDVEKVLELAPEVVIDANMGQSDADRKAFWSRYEAVPAVKAGRVETFDDPSLLRQGPRLVQALDTFERVISPPAAP
jgi:iron complex transport system substrate-binding protein